MRGLTVVVMGALCVRANGHPLRCVCGLQPAWFLKGNESACMHAYLDTRWEEEWWGLSLRHYCGALVCVWLALNTVPCNNSQHHARRSHRLTDHVQRRCSEESRRGCPRLHTGCGRSTHPQA